MKTVSRTLMLLVLGVLLVMSMRRTIAFVLLITATVLLAGCTTADNSNAAGNANMAATPANANTGTANTNNANTNMPANMNMSNMNMGKPNKKANANKTP